MNSKICVSRFVSSVLGGLRRAMVVVSVKSCSGGRPEPEHEAPARAQQKPISYNARDGKHTSSTCPCRPLQPPSADWKWPMEMEIEIIFQSAIRRRTLIIIFIAARFRNKLIYNVRTPWNPRTGGVDSS